jgi:hypothetical protein
MQVAWRSRLVRGWCADRHEARLPGRRGAGPGVEGGGDERVPHRVRAHLLADPRAAGNPAHDPGSAVPVQPFPVHGEEQGPADALADRQVDRTGGTRGEWDGGDLVALAGNNQCSVASLEAQVLDVCPGGLEDRRPLRASREISARSAAGPSPARDEKRADLVAVEGGGVGFVVQPGAGGRARRASGRGGLPRRRTCRTRRWWTGAG